MSFTFRVTIVICKEVSLLSKKYTSCLTTIGVRRFTSHSTVWRSIILFMIIIIILVELWPSNHIHFIALNPGIVDKCGHSDVILIFIYYKCYITVFDKVLSIHL